VIAVARDQRHRTVRCEDGVAGADFSSAIVTLPTGVTVLPEIENTDTVPSLRLATSASVPRRLIEMPAALLPASSVAITAGGDAVRFR